MFGFKTLNCSQFCVSSIMFLIAIVTVAALLMKGNSNYINSLTIKNVKKWYFGLYTALKLNNMTHEYFTIDYIINDKLLRTNPMKIAGHKFKFLKLKKSLSSFGITHKDTIACSDPEKTILDFIYIWRYSGIPKDSIIADVDEWSTNLSIPKLKEYSKNYPKTVQKIAHKLTESVVIA